MLFAVREADFAKADSLNHYDRGGEAYTVAFQLLAAYHKHDAGLQQKLWPIYLKQATAIHLPKPGAIGMLTFYAMVAGDLDAAESILAELDHSARDTLTVQMRAFSGSELTAYRGQLRSAIGLLQADGLTDSDWMGSSVKARRGALLFVPYRAAAREELLAFRDAVLRDSTARVSDDSTPDVSAQYRLYWAGLANCQLGNIAEAMRQADRLETLNAPPYWRDAMRALATDVRAFADVARGDNAQALRRIESIPADAPLDLRGTAASRHVEIAWHGELLYRVGRYDEALQWFENVVVDPEFMSLTPFYTLRRAQIYDRRGDTRKAALLYGQFLDFWKNPDSELRPLVRDARARLAVIQRKVD